MTYRKEPRKSTSTNRGKVSISEKDVIAILARAQSFEFSRQIQESFECLSPIWDTYTNRPATEQFSPTLQAEILLRCGALLSYFAHYKNLHHQQLAHNWIIESIELFDSEGISDKIAEAETELAMIYWREDRHSESLGWLESAGLKITNNLSMVSIKNISYQLLVLFSLNTPQSLQTGAALIKEQDTYVELCPDKRVKPHYYNNSALLMSRLGQDNDALARHKKAVQFCKEINNQICLAIAENNIGYIYSQLHKFDKAIEHTHKAIAICQNLGISVREGECWDTLAEIYLTRQVNAKSKDFNEALKAINKSLEMLSPMGKINQQSGYSSLIGSLQTKSKILLNQGNVSEALMVFAEIQQIVPKNIAEAAAHDFSRMIEFVGNGSLTEKTVNYERKLLEKAILTNDGDVDKIAEALEISRAQLVRMLETRHRDLHKRYRIKLDAKIKNKFRPVKRSNKSKLVSRSHGNPKSANNGFTTHRYLGFPVLIPESVKVMWLMPISDARLASAGLVEGRLAVIGSPSYDHRIYPSVIQEPINSRCYYGFKIDSMGLIGLETDNSDNLRVFDPELVKHIGNIVGYCEFNTGEKKYEFYPLKIKD